jgi:hypothetical protein
LRANSAAQGPITKWAWRKYKTRKCTCITSDY